MAQLILPQVLQRFTDNTKEIQLQGQTFSEIKAAMQVNFPELYDALFHHTGTLNAYANFAHNQVLIQRHKLNEMTIDAEDTLEIIPALSGG